MFLEFRSVYTDWTVKVLLYIFISVYLCAHTVCSFITAAAHWAVMSPRTCRWHRWLSQLDVEQTHSFCPVMRLSFSGFQSRIQVTSTWMQLRLGFNWDGSPLPVLRPHRAWSAEVFQEEEVSDQLALLERLQHAAGQRAPVPDLALPQSGTALRTTPELPLLSGARPAQACHGELSAGHVRWRAGEGVAGWFGVHAVFGESEM